MARFRSAGQSTPRSVRDLCPPRCVGWRLRPGQRTLPITRKVSHSLIQTRDGDVRISVKVKPRAPRSRVVDVREGALVVAVAAAPVDGEANAELTRTIARWLDVARSSVRIVAGMGGRNKIVSVADVTETEVRARLPR